MSSKSKQTPVEPINLLIDTKSVPQTKTQQFYQKLKFKNKNFGQVWGPETHLRRRKFILEDHPQIAKLLVADKPYSMILAILLVSINLSLTYVLKDSSWPVLFTIIYIFGATINHTLHILIHDFTHWSGHQNIIINKIFAIFCNIPMGIPSALSFGRYHSDHHNFMGEVDKDPDLPTYFQIEKANSTLKKLLYFILMSPIYALRPFLIMHKQMNQAEIINNVVIICTNLLIYKFWGTGALAYVLISGSLSIGAHPAAIHVIAEHAQFVKGLQTYDYIGIWNILNLNVGYHVEHHDFPSCPWYNLPKLREMAKQYYENIPYHTSYIMCLYKFIFDQNFCLLNRTIRIPNPQEKINPETKKHL